jgi:hypothetical protein
MAAVTTPKFYNVPGKQWKVSELEAAGIKFEHTPYVVQNAYGRIDEPNKTSVDDWVEGWLKRNVVGAK